MQFEVLTIFPQLFEAFCSTGVLGKALDRDVVGLKVHDLRDWAGNRWRHKSDLSFDAFYAQHDKIFDWIKNYRGGLISIYTDHLADEHVEFFKKLEKAGLS